MSTPDFRPMMATIHPTLPVGAKWSYEVKWDGYRALLVKEGRRARLISRNLKDLTADYPHLADAASQLVRDDFVLDGEIVALAEDGRPSFQALQHRTTTRAVVFYAFDLLRLGQSDCRSQPLEARRSVLHELPFAAPILLSEPLPGSAQDIEVAVRREGLEGVVAKRLDSPYESGKRTETWIKVKFHKAQEFVVGGYKPHGRSFDSVLVGYYEGTGFLCAGKVRAGFNAHTRRDVLQRIEAFAIPECPFVNLPSSVGRAHWGEGITAEDMLELRWVEPRVTIQVAFTEWTAGGSLRHAAFVGVREDKDARDVHRSA